MPDACLAELPGGLECLAETIEGLGFATAIADLAEQCQGLLVMLGGLQVATLPRSDEAEAGQHIGFAGPVADLAAQSQGLLVVVGGL